MVHYRLNYGDEMTQVLRHWRKRRFAIQEEKRLAEEIELQTYLGRLIREDRDRQVFISLLESSILSCCVVYLFVVFYQKIDQIRVTSGAKGDTPETNDRIASVERYSDNCMAELNNLFAKVDERRRVR